MCVCACAMKRAFCECCAPTLTVESQHEYYISPGKYATGNVFTSKIFFGSVSICLLNNYYKLRAIFPYFHVSLLFFSFLLFYYFQNATMCNCQKCHRSFLKCGRYWARLLVRAHSFALTPITSSTRDGSGIAEQVTDWIALRYTIQFQNKEKIHLQCVHKYSISCRIVFVFAFTANKKENKAQHNAMLCVCESYTLRAESGIHLCTYSFNSNKINYHLHLHGICVMLLNATKHVQRSTT